ncbi:MAG TPA: hypothetical protein VKT73_13030 [Xanthobacteraceae bacterium]|nr:hypothetical protein [Xanthobacteraceae bacterium]
MKIHEIDWRDVTPPGSRYELHAAPAGNDIAFRHRRIERPTIGEPRSNHMTRGPWTPGLPPGLRSPFETTREKPAEAKQGKDLRGIGVSQSK